VDTFDIIMAISALEMALKKFCGQVQHGKGVTAAQEILLEAY
jgi:aspartate aminotransferase-like enzyme